MNVKEKLLKATLKHISKSGIHGLAMGPLSQSSGIAVGNFYHHFSSKEGLIDNLYIYCRQQMGNALATVDNHKHNYRKQFTAFCEILYSHFIKNKAAFVFLGEAELGKAVSKEAMHQGEQALIPLIEFLYHGMENKKIRNMDVDLALKLIYQSVGTAVLKGTSAETPANAENREMVIEFAWQGLKMKKK